MNWATERLIEESVNYLGRSQGDVPSMEFADRLTMQSMAYALIAIAQELKRHNDEDELERERQEVGR